MRDSSDNLADILVTLIILVALVALTLVQNGYTRDLQRRVGQLEQVCK